MKGLEWPIRKRRLIEFDLFLVSLTSVRRTPHPELGEGR
jgi:hypothetical protein